MTAHHPDVLTRLRAAMKREVSATDVEALRGAGAGVYDQLIAAEERRRELTGQDGWKLSSATQAWFLAYWCAFANQQLGEAFLDEDYKADPGTVGYVPPVTKEQAEVFFTEVADWLRRIARAEVDSSYRFDVDIPHALPGWVDVDPCPRAHLLAMLAACEKIVEHAEIAVNDLNALGADKHPADFGRLMADLAEVKSAAKYATDLHAQLGDGTVSQELHERVENSVKAAIEGAYRIGQLAAMPQLAGQTETIGRRHDDRDRTATRLPLPSQHGFDMWCLTDPETRRRWRRDPAAVRAIEMLWQYDPNPAATLAIQAEIDDAEHRGDIRRNGQGNYFCCPWAAIYQVLNPVTIGDRRLRRGQTFTYDVSAEEMSEGGAFKRNILVANFQPTTRVDYCNPEEEGHDD